jgi:hypothetical protein
MSMILRVIKAHLFAWKEVLTESLTMHEAMDEGCLYLPWRV